MSKNFGAKNWKEFIPKPIFDKHPEYNEFYNLAWQIAFDHIKYIDGMPQNPYMDEAFCATQIWIVDSCFMSFFCKYAREVFPGVETLNNFYDVLYSGKHLPKIITPENEPDWTTAKPNVPFEIKVHIADNPPLFAWAEYENALISGDIEYIKQLLYDRKVLQSHYEWIENIHEHIELPGVLSPTCLLTEKYGYKWEGGRSCMDNTPRGRLTDYTVIERPNNPDMLWIDAICQQALSAKTIAKLFAILGDSEKEKEWNSKFEEKKTIVNKLYWDKTDNFYYDIDCNTHEHYKVKTIASYWALTAEIAPEERASILAEHILNPETFGGFVPLVSLARNDSDYSPTGKYWRGSVWLPTAYAALKGIANYGYLDIAHAAGLKLLDHMYKTYKEFEPHTIWECYNPEKYMPATTAEDLPNEFARKDFCGWSALGPISVYIEYVLGLHSIDAFSNTIKWAKPQTDGNIGIKNLRFGKVITDIVANGNNCTVISNAPYTLEIDGNGYEIKTGKNSFSI